MSPHYKTLDLAIPEAVAILDAPMATIYNTEGHISYYGSDGTTSVNVWHCPALKKEGSTELHTHQFHGCSTVLAGRLVNTLYTAADDGEEIDFVEMVPGSWKAAGELRLRVSGREASYQRGESYCIPYRDLHRAVSPGLAITLFRRSQVHHGEPIIMQVGGRLGCGGISWSPGPSFTRLLGPINRAARAILLDEHTSFAAIEALLREASGAVDAYIPAPVT